MGRLGKDPEQQTLANGKTVAKTTVAVRETADKATWFNVVAWEKTAEALMRCQKGDLVGLEGRMSCREYEKDGKKVYWWDMVANRVHYTGKRGGDREATPANDEPLPF